MNHHQHPNTLRGLRFHGHDFSPRLAFGRSRRFCRKEGAITLQRSFVDWKHVETMQNLWFATFGILMRNNNRKEVGKSSIWIYLVGRFWLWLMIGCILRSNNFHNSPRLVGSFPFYVRTAFLTFLQVLVLVMLALADSPRRSLPWELKSQQSQVQWIETTLNPKASWNSMF